DGRHRHRPRSARRAVTELSPAAARRKRGAPRDRAARRSGSAGDQRVASRRPPDHRNLQQRRRRPAASAHAPQSGRRPRQCPRTARASLPARPPSGVFQRQSGVPGHSRHSVYRRSLAGRADQSGCRMSKIRTLVVDDEPIARARVVSLLKEEADIEVIGECANGQQAMSAIESGSPDLLFLDLQMPEVNGLDLARTIQSTGTPAVVFVTAYDEYALRAFEVHALDFLLKPFSAERFRSALGHAREQVSQRRKGAELPKITLPDRRTNRPNRLMIKSGGRIHFVRMADIDWCEAQGNYVRVHVGAQEHLVRDTMSHLESEL